MDNALSKLLSFPPHPPPPNPLSDHQYDEGIKEQIKAIKSLPIETLLQKTSGGEHALDVGTVCLIKVCVVLMALAGHKSSHKYNTILLCTSR